MILQALKEYYDRKAADPESGIAPVGWEYKEIPFIIVINHNSDLIQIEDTREGLGRGKKAKTFLIPRAVNRSSNIKANLLWDKAEYIFPGIDINKDNNKLEQQRVAFKTQIRNDLGEFECIQILLTFLDKIDSKRLSQEYCWDNIKDSNPNIAFRFKGESNLIFHRKDIINKINTLYSSQYKQFVENSGICLLSGEPSVIKKIHSKTPINRKNNSLVSFQKNSGYDSYGKEQGLNAPISDTSEFAYVTALKTLLKSKRQRFSIGDGTYVCWSAEKTNFESDFLMFFDDPDTRNNPDLFSENVKVLYQSITDGIFIENEGNHRFYLLGLSPGGGTRISVRFWDIRTIAELANNIRTYFNDLSISKPSNYPEYFSIGRLLASISKQGDYENIPPKLAGEMIRSIVCDLPYPQTLLRAAISRTRSGVKKRTSNGTIKVERVTPEIAALIKGYLNRYYRIYPDEKFKEVLMELDINQPSLGYQLGRLFATLEKIQEEANRGINSTIRERFYGAACATPVTVFPNLIRLKNHHLAKMENKGRVVNFERLLGEIMGNITDFPAHLDLHEQGHFAIGYYHQRQIFYKSKERLNNHK